jgi:hypothetical protein
MRHSAPTIFLLTLCLVSQAGLRLGSGVYEISELTEAQAEASKEGKPVTFLLTKKDSTCPLCNNAGKEILDQLDRDTVVVYLEDARKAPKKVGAALKSGGKYIPKAAVFTPDLAKSLGLVTYESIDKEGRKAFDDVEDAIKEAREGLRRAGSMAADGERLERAGKFSEALDAYAAGAELGNGTAAEALARLTGERDKVVAEAGRKRKAGEYYEAVAMLQKVVSRFGAKHAPKAAEQLADMKQDERIRDEVAAEVIYRRAKAKRDKSQLQTILDNYPKTAAAGRARKVLQTTAGNGQ